jgi:hypothetical protein
MKEEKDDKIPLFNSWTKWYVFVLGFHLLLIVLFKLFTNYFA